MAITKERATVQLTETAKAEIEESAERLGLTTPEYIRRALALTRTLDEFMDNGRLTVVDHKVGKDGTVSEQRVLVTTALSS